MVRPTTGLVNFLFLLYVIISRLFFKLLNECISMTGDLGRHGGGLLYAKLSKRYKRVAQKSTQVNFMKKPELQLTKTF